MSYTPGPWRVNESKERVWIEGTGRGCGVPRIAIVDDSAGTEPGNANLLAAAPELLEALEELASVINESEGVAGWHLNGAVAPWSEFGFAQKIEDVIKKARGAE